MQNEDRPTPFDKISIPSGKESKAHEKPRVSKGRGSRTLAVIVILFFVIAGTIGTIITNNYRSQNPGPSVHMQSTFVPEKAWDEIIVDGIIDILTMEDNEFLSIVIRITAFNMILETIFFLIHMIVRVVARSRHVGFSQAKVVRISRRLINCKVIFEFEDGDRRQMEAPRYFFSTIIEGDTGKLYCKNDSFFVDFTRDKNVSPS